MQVVDVIKKGSLGLDDNDDEGTVVTARNLASDFEFLLSFLWASENDFLEPVELEDIPESPIIDQLLREIKEKLAIPREPTETEREGNLGSAEAWALSSQSIVRELNRMHASREEQKNAKEENASLLKNMGPSQRALFTTLSTNDMEREPLISPLMKNLLSSKAPQKAIGLLHAETRDWEGTFSDGCVHRFLSSGFLSLNANRANPGGFTVFMFHPKTIPIGGAKGFDQDTAALREYFDLDVDDSTIAFYAKQGYFHPKNVHDLRIQLQTALDFIKLITCPDSIATEGLAYILDPNVGTESQQCSTTDSNRKRISGPSFCKVSTEPYKSSGIESPQNGPTLHKMETLITCASKPAT